MISFLNSGILFLASAIVIPILIYLFAKKRPKKIVFSTIRFIKESQQQQKKRINLKNLILLLIRMLIILLVILAISRPAIRSEILTSSSTHPKTALAIIIDNSYSMNYLVDTQTEMEKAKEIAFKINEMLNEDDVVILLTADENWNELHGNSTFGKFDTDLIKELKITSKSLSTKDVLENAEKKLSEIHLPNREIIMISDLQQSELPDQMTIPTFLIPTSDIDDRVNISCEKSRLQNEIVKKGLQKKISFELVNHSNSVQQDVIYRLFLDGNTISEKVTDLQPKQLKTETFELELETEGWHSGYVEVKNERLIFDNRSFFSFFHDASLRVAVLSDLPQLPLTLDSILEIYTGDDGTYDLISTDELNSDFLKTYDNIIVYKRTFSPRLEFILDDLQSKNMGILFIADENLNVDSQDYLAKKFSLQFSEFNHFSSPVKLSYANPYHPISREIKNVESIQINDFWKTSKSADALLKSADLPVAIQKEKSCLWLFDVASLQNPFLLNNAFPVFAYNSLRFTSQSDLIISSKKVGDQLSGSLITLPNGNEITPGNKKVISEVSGIYKIDDKLIPVNLDYAESSYSRLSKPHTKNLQVLETDWQQNILHSRYGFEIWKYLLIFVLILFALEMFIVKKEETK
ncbi:MAG: BatA domain-containing protein [Candidatus Cloacimonetes bacterium]|nr:BatA domain-containing protein [Candidatus Cloacimonadota bacterium]MCF7813063.1 BatA domain-containing protein [Candidatus Cloacimonadota bacterium]MCF7867196.1 BatA domain-containing protein [Candidatus Cloacimonadota bacterium]MCF7882640.1 BatA domain-containing protein [Candidatus Cloacimonadota bacterium]